MTTSSEASPKSAQIRSPSNRNVRLSSCIQPTRKKNRQIHQHKVGKHGSSKPALQYTTTLQTPQISEKMTDAQNISGK